MPKRKAMLLVLVGVCMVSYSGPLVKAALLQGATPVSVALMRMVLSALMMLPIALKKAGLSELRFTHKSVYLKVFLASICLALHYLSWMTSLNQTSTFASVALVCTQPLFVMLLSSVIFKEKIKRSALPGAVTALLGALLIAFGGLHAGGGQSSAGDLLALSGAALMAGHWLFSRDIRRSLSGESYSFLLYAQTALMLCIMVPFAGGFRLPGLSVLYVFFLAGGCTMLGHALFTLALGTISANHVAFALLFEPVGAMIWAVLFFKEVPPLMVTLGGITVLIGLSLFLCGDMKHVKPKIAKSF